MKTGQIELVDQVRRGTKNIAMISVISIVLLSVVCMIEIDRGEEEVSIPFNFGGSGPDILLDVAATSDGGYVAVGYSNFGSTVTPGDGDWEGISGKGLEDAIIVKFGSDGIVEWKKNFGGSGHDRFEEVIETYDGKFVAVGYSNLGSIGTAGTGDWIGETSKGGYDATIVKFGSNGTVEWKKNFGGNGRDDFYGIIEIIDGYLAVGRSDMGSVNASGTGDWSTEISRGGYDATIVKFGSDGTVGWKKNFGGENIDWFYRVISVSDGYVVVGFSDFGVANTLYTGDWFEETSRGGYDATIVKFGSNGTVEWKKNFGGSDGDSFSGITGSDDGYVAVGYSHQGSFGNGDWTGVEGKINYEGAFLNSDAIIVKFNSDGDVLWKKNFGGSYTDTFSEVMSIADGYIAVGFSVEGSFGTWDWTGVEGHGGLDAIIVKLDTEGSVIAKRNFGGENDDTLRNITMIASGMFIAVGDSNLGAPGTHGTGDWTGAIARGSSDAVTWEFNVRAIHSGSVMDPNDQSIFLLPLIFVILLAVSLYLVHNRIRQKN